MISFLLHVLIPFFIELGSLSLEDVTQLYTAQITQNRPSTTSIQCHYTCIYQSPFSINANPMTMFHACKLPCIHPDTYINSMVVVHAYQNFHIHRTIYHNLMILANGCLLS